MYEETHFVSGDPTEGTLDGELEAHVNWEITHATKFEMDSSDGYVSVYPASPTHHTLAAG
jgi:hypothetical protein